MLRVREAKARGIEFDDQGCYAAGMIVLEQVVQVAPDDALAWLVLSDCYKAVGRRSDCRRALDISLLRSPSKRRWIVYARLAILENQLGHFKESEEWFLKASLEAEDDAKEWIAVLRGENLIASEDFLSAEQVIQSLRQEQRELENEDEVLNVLGRALLGQNRLEEAKHVFLASASIAGRDKLTDKAAIAMSCLDEARAIAESIRDLIPENRSKENLERF